MQPLADRPEVPDRSLDLATAFASHWAFVRERLRGLGVAAADLDDAAQDVFLVLVRRIAEHDPDRPIRHWLSGIARRVARRHRERTRARVIPLDPERSRAPTDLDDAVRRSEAERVLESFLAGLDQDRWAVFVLAEIEGLRGSEIAAELELNLNTVYARLRSARVDFERALRRHRARERRGLAALLPFGLGRDGGWPAVIGAGALTIVAAVGVAAYDGCGADEPAQEDAARAPAPAGEVPSPAVGSAAPVSAREADPALPAAKAFVPPRRDPEGWYAGGSGMSTSGERTLSHEARYRFDGDRVTHELTYIGDDEVPTEAVGYFVLDGLELVAGKLDYALSVEAEATRVITTTFRAKRDGCVVLHAKDGRRPAAGEEFRGSGRTHRFVLDAGALRHARDDRECEPYAHPTEEALSGVSIEVDVHNDCESPVEFTVFANPEGRKTPPSVPSHRLEPGEHRRMRVDSAQWFRRKAGGGGIRLEDDGEVHFQGEDCTGIRGGERDVPAPPPPR